VLDEHHVRATAPRGVNTSKTMLRGREPNSTPCVSSNWWNFFYFCPFKKTEK
jgi:hypothetical protein